MTRHLQFAAGLLILLSIEFLKTPAPGTPTDMSRFIDENIYWLRIIGWLVIVVPVIFYFTQHNTAAKVIVGLCLVLYAVIFIMMR